MAMPRVLAAVLEYGWREGRGAWWCRRSKSLDASRPVVSFPPLAYLAVRLPPIDPGFGMPTPTSTLFLPPPLGHRAVRPLASTIVQLPLFAVLSSVLLDVVRKTGFEGCTQLLLVTTSN
jgi:hypothetical protein